jgi:CubicO group peptidase (beta-lactamase class C family)
MMKQKAEKNKGAARRMREQREERESRTAKSNNMQSVSKEHAEQQHTEPEIETLLGAVKDPRDFGVNTSVFRGYEAAMQKMVQRGDMPGCASVVFRRGEVIHTGRWGYADLETKTKFNFDTICRLYCMTKPYIALCFITLVEEGKANLGDRVDKYLPKFANVRVQLKGSGACVRPHRPILMRHVLTHTSGIDYCPDLGEKADSPLQRRYAAVPKRVVKGTIRTLKTFVDHVAKCPLVCHPGDEYHYGFSMDVVARVIEVITGKSLKQALKERVFDPLGMADTGWSVPDSELHRLAACYGSPTTWGWMYGDRKGYSPITPKSGLCRIDGRTAKDSHWREGRECSVTSGGGYINYECGGLVSTLADTARFVHMLAHRGVTLGGRRYLKKKTIDLLEGERLNKSWGIGQACYLGNIGDFSDGRREVCMGGLASTYWSVNRDDDVATVWFTQNLDFPDLDDKNVPPDADLWKVMHKACTSDDKKRKSVSGEASPSKRRRSSPSN